MATEFKFPDVGEGVTEGTLLEWLVDEGDAVEEDESLAEVETDKAVVEVPAPHKGTILKLHAAEGDTITVGDVIVTLGEEGEEASDTVSEDAEETEASEGEEKTDAGKDDGEKAAEDQEESGSTSVVGEIEEAPAEEEAGAGTEATESEDTREDEMGPTGGTGEPVSGKGKVLAAPSTRRLAREKEVDIQTVEGTGPGGRVTKEDVERATEGGEAAGGADGAAGEAEGGRVLATPAVRRLAKEEGVDIDAVEGSGPGGRITEEDVKHAASREAPREGVQEESEEAEAVSAPAGELGTGARMSGRPVFDAEDYGFEEYGEVEREEMSRVRTTIAEHMEKSVHVAPHVTATDDADVTELWDVRQKEKKVAESRDIHLTFLPFIMKAAITALKEYPYMNASIDEETGDIIKKQYYNVGVAVATDHGLLVPVIKDADQKSILTLAKEIEEKAEKARNRELSIEEMRGGTFTLTNWGSIGGKYGTPILNYPEVGILGIGTISKEPVVVDDEITVRRMMPLSLTFDHRLIDGAYAAQFMNTVVTHLEDPDLLLIDE